MTPEFDQSMQNHSPELGKLSRIHRPSALKLLVVSVIALGGRGYCIWASGLYDVLTEKWEGQTVIDRDAITQCRPDEWLLLEAWDES